MRAVLDPNVLISAAISRKGAPAEMMRMWRGGSFELIVSPGLLAELERALAYPKVARLVSAQDAGAMIAWLRAEAELREDPVEAPPVRSTDPGDDYLLALSIDAGAALVSGDKHLLDLAGAYPIYRPAEFLERLR